MKAPITLLFFVAVLSLAGQVTLSGNITDKTGSPLLGVNIYLEGTYDGATSDINGYFSFETYEKDSLKLVVSYIGFHKQVLPIDPKTQSFAIQLKEQISQLNAVVITAGSFNASDESKREVLKPLDVATTAGATADIPGALNTLPGTQRVGETGRLFVRGGEGREAKTFIDGMLVFNEYSPAAPNTPSRSRFSPFMFKGTSFSTGGYSAEYGQALSSALILNSKDIAEHDRTDFSLMSVGADVSATRALKNGSFAGKVQYTNLLPYFALVNQNLEWDKAPEEINGNFAYRIKTSKTGMLKLYTSFSTAHLDLYEADIANPEISLPVSVSNDYAYVNASYRELLNDRWGFRAGASVTRSKDVSSLGELSQGQDLLGYHTKVVADYQHSDRLAFIVGGESVVREIEQQLVDGESLDQALNEQISATFLESEFFASKDLAFKVGLRGEHSNLTSRIGADPRISAAYKTGKHSQVSIAYGRFRQAASTQVQLTDTQAPQEKATHFIANYQWVQKGQTFRVEAYEKRYAQLARYEDALDAATFQFNGHGYARGLEFFWRDSKSVRELDYWVSYSYLNTERDYRDFPGTFTPSFASAHNFSVVTKKFIEPIKSQVGVTYSYASPRTYDDRNDERFMSGRTPSYHDLSFNISYLHSSQIIVHALVNNVLGINNIFGYEYASEPGANGTYASRPITPAAKRFIFVGVFITLSKNKGINQLPNL